MVFSIVAATAMITSTMSIGIEDTSASTRFCVTGPHHEKALETPSGKRICIPDKVPIDKIPPKQDNNEDD